MNLLGKLLIFLSDLLRSLGPLDDLPTLLLQTFLAEAIIDGALVRVAQH